MKLLINTFLIIWLVTPAFVLAAPLDIKSQKQLFIDGYMVESSANLTQTQHTPTKVGPLISPINDWEGVGSKCPTVWVWSVLPEDGKFRMWYTTLICTDAGNSGGAGYIESTDGITWTGRKKASGMTSVIRNNNNPPDKRYMGWGGCGGTKSKCAYSSPDGLSWSLHGTIGTILGDVGTMAYDSVKQEYMITAKGTRKDGDVFNPRKSYSYSSTNLSTFSSTIRNDYLFDATDAAGYVKAASYGIGMWPYEGVYIGFNWLFLITAQLDGGGEDGYIEVDLLFKRQIMAQWSHPSHDPILPRGANGSWDDGMVMTASSPMIVGKEIWLYYTGWDGTHAQPQTRTSQIGLAKWRLDGFYSVDAGATEGSFVSPALTFTGKNLLLNADASNSGSIQVELQDANGAVISGYAKADCNPITKDNVEHMVSWTGGKDISALAGTPIKLKVYMKNAELYAVKFGKPEFAPFITLSNQVLPNAGQGGNEVGTLALENARGDSITFSLPAGKVDNADFTISDDKLISANAVDFNTKNSYTVLVKAEDNEGNVTEVEFILEVEENGIYTSWAYSKNVVLNTTVSGANVSGTVKIFPVLLKLRESNFDFAQAGDNGEDLRFLGTNDKVFPHEIAWWDATAKHADVWVLVDSVLGNNDTQYFTMYWGKTGVKSKSDGNTVFDTANGFVNVWHLDEEGNSGANGYNDATYTAENGTGGAGMTAASDTASAAGRGQWFDGSMDASTEYINMGSTNSLDGVTGLSVSFWCNPGLLPFTDYPAIFARGTSANRTPWIYGMNGANNLAMNISKSAGVYEGIQTPDLQQGVWQYVTLTWDGSKLNSYINLDYGDSSTTTITTVGPNDQYALVGVFPSGRRWYGGIDELKTSRVARSEDWHKLSYMNQKSDQVLLEYGQVVAVEQNIMTEGVITGAAYNVMTVYNINGQLVKQFPVSGYKPEMSSTDMVRGEFKPGLYVSVFGNTEYRSIKPVSKRFAIIK
ncbi:MAG: DUF2341 domain-containing protein [Fibrobacteria bacterium]|nr:DUF2341 domain-containing protein [Fibrobacteria bacterium]